MFQAWNLSVCHSCWVCAGLGWSRYMYEEQPLRDRTGFNLYREAVLRTWCYYCVCELSRYLWSLYKGHCISVIVQLVFCAFVLSIRNKILSIRLWQMTTNLASGFHCALPFESYQLTTFISRVCPNLTTDQIQDSVMPIVIYHSSQQV